MKKLLTKGQIAILVIFSVLIIDQVIKIWIKTHMYWHESIRITDWFYIYFTENNGMAFGMELFGKLFLTTFRIVAVGLIGWYLYKIVKRGLKTGYIICVSLILTGALGNIIDSVFYGVIFNESTHSQPVSCLMAAVILLGSMVKLSICSISRSLIPTGRHGCLLSEENILFSSVRSLILQMPPLVAELLPYYYSTANT